MKCPKCGYVLPADSEFCQYCGEKLPAEAEDTDVVTVPIAERPSQTSEQQSSVESSQLFEEESVLPSYKESESANEDIVSNYYQAETATDNNDSTPASNIAPIHDKKKKYCKYCGGLIDPETKKCFSCEKQFFRFPKKTVSIIALIIAFVVLAGLNVYQYVCNDSTVSGLEQQLETSGTTISDLEQQIKAKDSTISAQKSTIATQNNKIAELEEKAESYNEICSFLSSGNIGYAADNFKSSDSIILVRKGETNRKFTLTAYWSNGGTVSTSYSSFLVAGVSYDNDNWSRSTTMTINPRAEGINVITFTNDVDSKTFKIMIIVTE